MRHVLTPFRLRRHRGPGEVHVELDEGTSEVRDEPRLSARRLPSGRASGVDADDPQGQEEEFRAVRARAVQEYPRGGWWVVRFWTAVGCVAVLSLLLLLELVATFWCSHVSRHDVFAVAAFRATYSSRCRYPGPESTEYTTAAPSHQSLLICAPRSKIRESGMVPQFRRADVAVLRPCCCVLCAAALSACVDETKPLPQAKLIQLIKLAEGPGPSLQKATLDTVINELAQEGRIKRKTAPAPEKWAW